MITTIDSSNMELTWGTKGNSRIIQNIANLLKTRKYEVAYDRTLGLSGNFTDKPADQAVALATAEIADMLSQSEPRAALIEVLYDGADIEGNMRLKVVIDI